MRIMLSGFIAGVLAVVIFHQGSAFLLHHVGNDISAVVAVFGKAAAPFNLAPTKPIRPSGRAPWSPSLGRSRLKAWSKSRVA